MRVMPHIEELPYALYRADQVREFDRIAIEEFNIPGAELMERAGSRAYQFMQDRWPDLSEIVVVCGMGNNGGDGYVVARLASQAGIRVRVLQLGDALQLKGDALIMAESWTALGHPIEPFEKLGKTDLIVDAILGTGLERDVRGDWASAIEQINRHPANVFAIDIPSGLHADTGRIMGCAIEARASISFIGLKQGMFTGRGPDCCGEIVFDALEIPARVYAHQRLACKRIDWQKRSSLILPRRRTAHKGDFGHLLVIAGDRGYPGAARLAAEAAARSGAGLVTLATHPDHAHCLNLGRPELMVRGVTGVEELEQLMDRADALVLGPGLGRNEWGEMCHRAASGFTLPLVIDADGLNWLADQPRRRENWILTPHPGEASRLLGCDIARVENDRFSAVEEIQQRFGGVVVLKGAGTLIGDGSAQPTSLCSDGNPGMATGGSGDVLSGIIGAMIAQGHPGLEAAELGVCLHAAAGDRAAIKGEIGLLAGDLLPEIRTLLNGIGDSV
ncbi:NAD(P)H-hydrate dehydratase [Candidatus Thiodiazotropha sp. CDECU1]|uniref:NAD(P)H-hydrate dehydratase n=1 Tax=Candidatus Thiodiazotropha sp. CDECU1 TaxID=3065865 RepID=UPI00292FE043|nr:NAD(P)H-hydrate dehydratase [Candidatus Thiodiazotropha sp. CDECU1]